MKYYVYVLLNPLKSGNFIYGEYIFKYEPFYVGKGNGKRKYETIRDKRNPIKGAILNKIKNEGLKPIRVIIKTEMPEQESFDLEIKLIDLIGRKDLKKGVLSNLTNGGEGHSGNKQSNETKLKRINSLKKYREYFKSKDFSEKMKVISADRTKKLKENGYYDELSIKYKGTGNPMFGKQSSNKQKDAVKKAHAEGKIMLSEEGRKKLIENGRQRKGKKNNNKRIDSNKYEIISPNNEKFIIFGAIDLQEFCKKNKLQFHVIKNNSGEITKDMVIGDKIFAKNTIGWKRI